ncbi:MAG TPA: class I SAM-dependent methyltransferase, partial [Actinomycetota bacterium]|nr:class I SAM-dependent methyltransferase [Actinomycetota bacterium]
GYGSAVLAARASLCVGLDLDAPVLVRATDRYRAARFVAGSALGLPFPDASFDAVGALQVIEHVSADVTDALVAEMARVVKSDGFAYVTTPNIAQLPATASKEFNPHHLRDFTPAELEAVLARQFADVQMFGQVLDESKPHVQRLLEGAAAEWKLVDAVARVERMVKPLPGPLRVRLRRLLLRLNGVPAWPLPEAEGARNQVRAEDFRAEPPADASGNTIAVARAPKR